VKEKTCRTRPSSALGSYGKTGWSGTARDQTLRERVAAGKKGKVRVVWKWASGSGGRAVLKKGRERIGIEGEGREGTLGGKRKKED